MSMENIILFDVDGILIDSLPIWENSANEYLWKVHGIDAPSYVDKNCETLSIMEAGEYIKSLYPSLEVTPKEIADGVAEMIRDRYWRVEGKPYMRETIKALKEMDYRLYLATASVEENVEGALRNLGVWEYFEEIFTCTEIGFGKKQEAYYEEIAKRLQVDCKDLIMVEDSLHSIQTAKRAGLHVVGVYEPYSLEQQEKIKECCDIYLMDLQLLPERIVEKKESWRKK